MNSKPSLTTIKKELGALKRYEVVLFGSYATCDYTPRSDIDVAIITRETSPEKNVRLWKRLLGEARSPFHVNVFELLPLPVKASLMQHYVVVFGDHLELSEYFYHFRKLWKDVKPRYEANQFKSFREKREKLLAAMG